MYIYFFYSKGNIESHSAELGFAKPSLLPTYTLSRNDQV